MISLLFLGLPDKSFSNDTVDSIIPSLFNLMNFPFSLWAGNEIPYSLSLLADSLHNEAKVLFFVSGGQTNIHLSSNLFNLIHSISHKIPSRAPGIMNINSAFSASHANFSLHSVSSTCILPAPTISPGLPKAIIGAFSDKILARKVSKSIGLSILLKEIGHCRSCIPSIGISFVISNGLRYK